MRVIFVSFVVGAGLVSTGTVSRIAIVGVGVEVRIGVGVQSGVDVKVWCRRVLVVVVYSFVFVSCVICSMAPCRLSAMRLGVWCGVAWCSGVVVWYLEECAVW
jgi:hypothetical protein